MRLISSVGIRVILALLFLNQLLIGIIQVAVPLYSLELGASHAALGIIAGAFTLVGIPVAIPTGVFSDHLGWRRVILASFLLWMAAGVVEFLSPSYLWLAWGQILIGPASLGLIINGLAYLIELSPPEKQSEVQSLSSGIMGLGRLVGPALAGYIGRFAGFRQVFALVILLGSLGFVLSFRLQETKAMAFNKNSLLREVTSSYRIAFELSWRNTAVLLAILLTTGTISWMSVGPSFYLEYLHHLGLPPEHIGFLAALRGGAGTLARFSFALVSNRIGVVTASLLGFAAGGLALTMTPFLKTVPLLAIVGCLGEAADQLRIPGANTMVADGTDRDSRALGLALVNTSWAVTSTFSPPILGLIAERMGLSATFLVAGPLAVLCAILLYTWKRSAA